MVLNHTEVFKSHRTSQKFLFIATCFVFRSMMNFQRFMYKNKLENGRENGKANAGIVLHITSIR